MTEKMTTGTYNNMMISNLRFSLGMVVLGVPLLTHLQSWGA